MTAGPMVDESFPVPDVHVADGLRLELLGPRHNEADHAAWTSSIEHIRSTPGFERGWPPAAGMTLAENLADLESHADRSARRVDFAYSVIEVATGDVVGCVYFKPAEDGHVTAASWVSAARAELDGPLTEVVSAWLREAWPFEVVHYRSATIRRPVARRLAGASRIGLGLAAVGRPAYINLGRASDLPAERTVDAMRERAHELLDDAYGQGIRYFDVARSYGRAEEFLAEWLDERRPTGVVVGSKWGYTYTAGWRLDAEVNEVKDHSVATFERQLVETRALLGDRLDLYQIHSLTPESSALHDAELHRRLADLAATGTMIGFSTSGPAQAEAIRAAPAIEVSGRPLFRSVQATWNLLEPSAGPALAEAHDAGCLVIVKEALANGRLAQKEPGDVVALAAALQQPWASIVLSGAATAAQLTSNLRAEKAETISDRFARDLAMPADRYWPERSRLRWE